MGKGGYLGGSSLVGWGAGMFSGRGSVTSQPATKGKATAGKPRKARKPDAQVKKSTTGAGLTIPEQVARAEKRVDAVKADITKTRSRLAELVRQLAEAERQLDAAQRLPRRSAVGIAKAKAAEGRQ